MVGQLKLKKHLIIDVQLITDFNVLSLDKKHRKV
jgi:hypothetical protein